MIAAVVARKDPRVEERGQHLSFRTRGVLREKPESVVREDFQDEMKKQLNFALSSELGKEIFIGPMGSIF